MTTTQYNNDFTADFDDKSFLSSSVGGGKLLEVRYQNWRSSTVYFDPTTKRELYYTDVDRHSCSSGHVPVKNENGQIIGTSKIHSMSSKIEVEMTGSTGASGCFEIKNDKMMGVGSPCYISPAFDGQELTWKNKAMSSKIIYTLMDGNSMAVARFESDPKRKVGSLEIVDSVTRQEQLDEIMVTLSAIVYRKLKSIDAAWVAAVVS